MFPNGNTHPKYVATFAVRLLKYVWAFWNVKRYRVNFKNLPRKK